MAEFNHWSQIAQDLGDALEEAIADTAEDGVGRVQDEIIANNQIVTGYMYDSVYKRTYNESTYGQVGSGPIDAYLLPEVDQPEDRFTAYFAVAANYAWFQNYGTRFIRPNPFFEPGVDRTVDDFERNLQMAFDEIR